MRDRCVSLAGALPVALALAFALAGSAFAELKASGGVAPLAEGGAFVMPELPVPATPAGAAELLAAITSEVSPESEPGAEPPARMRGSVVTAPPGCIGRPRLYQYTNSGVAPEHQYNACGQAAMATVLSSLGVSPEDPTNGVMRDVYARFPPNILFGKFGTSFKQVQRGLSAHGVKWRWEEGEDALMAALSQGRLAVVMLDVGATVDEGYGPLGGHWVVIYAADSRGVYLSNWPRDGHCTWHSLRRSWDTVMTRAFFGAPPWQSHRWFLTPWVAR